jgi:hypothetical protein
MQLGADSTGTGHHMIHYVPIDSGGFVNLLYLCACRCLLPFMCLRPYSCTISSQIPPIFSFRNSHFQAPAGQASEYKSTVQRNRTSRPEG